LLLTLIATPVVYSLLDDLKATSRWRRFAEVTAPISQGILEKLKPRRKPAPAERTSGGD
jgi:hypothetical protein